MRTSREEKSRDPIQAKVCVYHPEVTLSLFRRPKSRIPAIFYGYKRAGLSYGIKERNLNSTGFRVQDGVDIRFVEGSREIASFEHGKGEPWKADERLYVQLAVEEWVSYEFTVTDTSEASLYFVDLCVTAPNGGSELAITIDGESIETIETIEIKVNLWETNRMHNSVKLASGLHRIELKAMNNPIGIQWLEVIPS